MPHVTVRCHAELNDFLPRDRRGAALDVPCSGHESIKNLVESLGVPHPEIAALLVNDAPVDFGYQIRAGDQIEVYLAGSAPAGATPLRPPLDAFRFVLDTHLGRLAAYLRMLGFDTLYRNDYDDPELAQLAHDDGRVLLTRDIGLLKRSLVVHGCFVRETAPVRQLGEIVRRFDLYRAVASFQRCIRCNGLTQPAAKEAIVHLLEPKTRQYYDTFLRCEACGQIYWQGSHYGRMRQVIERVLRQETA